MQEVVAQLYPCRHCGKAVLVRVVRTIRGAMLALNTMSSKVERPSTA